MKKILLETVNAFFWVLSPLSLLLVSVGVVIIIILLIYYYMDLVCFDKNWWWPRFEISQAPVEVKTDQVHTCSVENGWAFEVRDA